MTRDDRQRRDGSAKRVRLTSGAHSGPNLKKKPRAGGPDRSGRKTKLAKEWRDLFARMAEVKKREVERRAGRG